MSIISLPNMREVIFNANNHTYTNAVTGIEYQSWSKVSKSLQVPFDKETVSRRMAEHMSRDKGISVNEAQQIILQEWEVKRKSSEDHGNNLHKPMEEFIATGKKSPLVAGTIEYLTTNILSSAYRYYPERLLYSHKYGKAGTADLVIQRQKGWQESIFDIYDYKTNEQKGIYFDSILRKNGIKHLNKFLLPPFDFIEDCNYALYSLQLNAYAYMLSETYKVRIGRLGIIFIDKAGNPTFYPVLYNPNIIEEIFLYYNNLQQLPIIDNDRYF